MTAISANWPSVNTVCQPLIEKIIADADMLQIKISRLSNDVRIIDAGINCIGGLEAGRRIAEICMGGLGTIVLANNSCFTAWPWSVNVHAKIPVLSCLGSQYAGWRLSHKSDDGQFFALASGPGRSLSGREILLQELGYQDKADSTCLVLEVDTFPPPEIAEKVATSCGVKLDNLTLILTPTSSLAGVMQIAARVLEVALHKAHTLGFAMDKIADGFGTTPVAPPGGDFSVSMGRTNDAILYGSIVHLFVNDKDKVTQDLAERMPSNTSSDYGAPFAELFKAYDYDFFKIDPMLFSPAKVIVTNINTGKSFTAGQLNEPLLKKSFGLQ